MDESYNVVCSGCGRVWEVFEGDSLWPKAVKKAEAGYLDAAHADPSECGCEPVWDNPDARYRVRWFDDMGIEVDRPFDSLLPAARLYLDIQREGWGDAIFVDAFWRGEGTSPIQKRIRQMAWH